MNPAHTAVGSLAPHGNGVTYDAGVLVAGDRGEARLWAIHRRLLEQGHVPTVPAGVLAQTWRGGPQATLSRLLAGCEIDPLDEPSARAAGAACALAATTDVVDASVVVGAMRRGDAVLTSDAADLTRISEAIGLPLNVVGI